MAASLILGVPMTQLDSASQPPNPSFNMDLWSTFLDNVDPLTKLLHAPSVRQKLIDATSKPEVVAKSTEALMWSISACAIASMSGTECRNMLGDSQTASLARYQSAAQHALLGCTFLKPSDLVILQAFVLLLVSLDSQYQHETLSPNLNHRPQCRKHLILARSGLSSAWLSALDKDSAFTATELHSGFPPSKLRCGDAFGGTLLCLMPVPRICLVTVVQ